MHRGAGGALVTGPDGSLSEPVLPAPREAAQAEATSAEHEAEGQGLVWDMRCQEPPPCPCQVGTGGHRPETAKRKGRG